MYECKKCGAKFEKSTSLGGHAVVCGVEKIKCDICGDEISKNMMTRHKEAHKKDTTCTFCGKHILAREGKKFCDHSCAAQFQHRNANRKPLDCGPCLECGKPKKRGNKFCSPKCENEHHYKVYINKWLTGDVSGNYHGDQISEYVRRWLYERSGGKCEGKNDDGSRCNWARVNTFTERTPLTAHHKDGNPRNTVPNNMELICPGCHSLTETYGSRNKGNGRSYRQEWRGKK